LPINGPPRTGGPNAAQDESPTRPPGFSHASGVLPARVCGRRDAEMTARRKPAAQRGSSWQRRTLQFESLEARQLQASDLEVALSGFAAAPPPSDLAAMMSTDSPTKGAAFLTDYLAVPETV